MAERSGFRVPWAALIPLLVFPLYGQTSCEPCPAPSNPCKRAAGRSTETNQCVYVNQLDGTACDDQGVSGVCSGGQCLSTECAGVEDYGICDAPLSGDLVGACVEDLCVAAVPYDECVKVGVGRINCCTQQGCAAASGAYCTDPLDGVSCDPTGLEPPGQAGQDGICDNGTCIAQSGLCADISCATSVDDPCVRDYCDAEIGQCQEWVVTQFLGCTSGGVDGVCHGGTCLPRNDPGLCGTEDCDDGNSCTIDLCIEESPGTFVCSHDTLPAGAACLDGESGQCFLGNCQPVILPCDDNVDCDDGNPCTINECEPTLSICETLPATDDTPCLGGQGLCRNAVCVPNLCIGRDCSDGNSCTQDLCESPYGICSNPNESNGTSCENNGQCFNGSCQPVIVPCNNDGDCFDGKSCTRDVCDPFLGCSNPRVPNGDPCLDGDVGTCIFGNCSIGG